MELRVGDSTVRWLALHDNLCLAGRNVIHALETLTIVGDDFAFEALLCATVFQIADIRQFLHGEAPLYFVARVAK